MAAADQRPDAVAGILAHSGFPGGHARRAAYHDQWGGPAAAATPADQVPPWQDQDSRSAGPRGGGPRTLHQEHAPPPPRPKPPRMTKHRKRRSPARSGIPAAHLSVLR